MTLGRPQNRYACYRMLFFERGEGFRTSEFPSIWRTRRYGAVSCTAHKAVPATRLSPTLSAWLLQAVWTFRDHYGVLHSG